MLNSVVRIFTLVETAVSLFAFHPTVSESGCNFGSVPAPVASYEKMMNDKG